MIAQQLAPVAADTTLVPPKTVYLHAGQLHVARVPTVVTTILGSCVSVCLWDERLRIGGINHYLLPHRIGESHAAARFGSMAIHQLLDGLAALGSRRGNLAAKVFGGASMLTEASNDSIGSKNARLALDILRDERVRMLVSDVGGTRGRKLIFNTESGEALVRVL